MIECENMYRRDEKEEEAARWEGLKGGGGKELIPH